MRHRKVIEKLGRNSSLKKATVRDLAKSVLIYQSITTTTAKAKVARKMVDHLISLGKENTLASRRRAFAILCDHNLVKTLFNEIAPRYKSRTGGYTRIFALLERRGDNASQSLLELTEKVIKEKIKREKPKKEETRPTVEEMPTEKPIAEEKPKPAPKPKPESKPKPVVKKEKAKEGPVEKPVEKTVEKPAEKPKAKEIEKPKAPERPKEGKAKGGLFGGLGKIFRKK